MIMEKMNETPSPNNHYGTSHHKYTINLPISLINEAIIKGKAAGFLELAPYIRAIISKEVQNGNMKLMDILGEKEFKRQGYILKHRREKSRYSFVILKAKNFLDKISNRQLYFWS